MKTNTSKQVLSILLAMVMLLGLLPAMAYAATYTKAGEITQITTKSTGFVTPALEGEVTLPYLSVTSPKDQNIHIFSDAVFTYWQKKDANGQWSKYTAPLFEEGIYRLHIAMFNTALDDGSYYALSSNTALTVDGTPWPTVGLFEDHYSETGRGQLEYYSPEYRVTAPEGYYKVTVTGDGNGTVCADVFYGKAGQTVTLTATPNRMYRLKQWQVISGGVTVANDQFVMGNSAVEIHAEFESFMVNAGEIGRVEVKSLEDLRPVIGRQLNYDMELTDPQDVNAWIWSNWTRWEKLQPDGSWKTYIDQPYTYGTYRMMLLLRSEAFEDGRYYPITKNTRLFVDGVEWTQIEAPRGSYTPEKVYGTAYYVSPAMEAIPLLTVSDECLHCSVVPVDGDLTVPMGDDFSFTLQPKEYYELTDPAALKVYVNDELVTPDANGVYTVKKATENLDVYADGGFTGYADLIITANGVTVKEKVYAGQSYTLKTVAGYGATVPDNSSFTHWKVSGIGKYQPGQSFTVNGGGEIRIDAVFSGLYNITVVGGRAYADAAHTIPLSVAAENQVIYIVADPAPEGKVFSYWNRTFAVVGGHGWFGDSEAAETTFTVYDSDVVLAPVYETLVDNIVINGMTKPSAGVAIDNSDYSYKWGCSVPANSGYSLGISYWYDITEGEPEFAMSSGDVFQIGHTYRFKARIHLSGDTVFPADAEDISVTLASIDAEDYQWTINEIGYTSATVYFEFTCEREKPDTTVERPEGSGTVGDPFKISTVGELYWFSGFTNNYVAVGEDFAVERNKAHAILMNDITVNPELLDSYVLNANSSLLADWTPICGSKDSPYCGTFDGQGYSISGLYYNTPGYQYDAYGFIAYMGEGGAVKDLTVKDTYFYIKYTSHFTPYVAGIAAYSSNATNTIENCHFDGVAGGDSSNKGCVAGGITAVTGGKIQNCTAKGRVLGYDSYVGYGKAGGIAGHAYSTAAISDCINYAEVLCWDSGSAQGTAGGIVGYLYGTVKDCSNRGVINGYDRGNNNNAGGIVGWASGTAEQKAVISRCFNMAYFSGSGIVDYISKGYVTVKNCYNAGSVTIGIAGITNGSGISITYCHDVGYTGKPIGGYSSTDDVEIDHCYYIDRVSYDTDRNPMTDAKLSEEFADGTVLALLNNGHWTQGEDDEYPVLGDAPGVTISGMVTSFGGESEKTTVQLFPSGSGTPAFSVTLTGTHAMYSFKGVEAGTYTMKVSKANHVTREYAITVGSSNVPKDAKIHLVGDVTGDGRVNVGDVARAYGHAKKSALLTDEYMMICADVTGDGRINVGDAARIYGHAKKTAPLW